MKLILKFFHLSSLTVWFGEVIFLSMIAPVMFRTFSREQAGDVMGAIFPVFYMTGYIAGFTALTTLILLNRKRAWFRVFLITVMFLATLYGGLVAGKKADHLRQEIKHEQDAGRLEVLKNKFHVQHRLSMISNAAVLILIPVVLLFTARNLSES
ncbi:MAG: DUF4149 domain-containing protein [Nitrospiria bacterium]